MNTHTERVLEFHKVLSMIQDRCRTTLGEHAALKLSPSFEKSVIERRLRETTEAMELLRKSLPPELGAVRDVRSSVMLAAKGSQLSGEEIFRVHETLECMAKLRRYLMPFKNAAPTLWVLGDQLPYLVDLANRIALAVNSEGEVLDTASDALKKIRNQLVTHQRRLASKLQSLISGALKAYVQEPIFTMRSGRYVIPIKAQYRAKVPGIVHDASATGQTVFVEPQAIIEEDDKLRELEAQEREEVSRILMQLSAEIGHDGPGIAQGLDATTEIDLIFARCYYAQDFHCASPKLVDEPMISVQAVHHPLLDRAISVPMSLGLGTGFGSLLITGPNTGGKTVALKTLGLCCLMIGCGIFPPADAVTFGPFSSLWADIGDEQSIQQSLSTFSGHLKIQSELLRKLKPGALVLIDEVGAGTDPREGAALGRAILEEITERGGFVAASTHYGELKAFAQQSDKFFCAAMEFDVESLRPTYRLLQGAAGASHAFEIAKRYGIPESVVMQGERYLGSDALDERKKTQQIDHALKQARDERQLAQQIRIDLERELEKLGRERELMREKLTRIESESQDAISEALRESRAQYREVLDMLNELRDRNVIDEGERNDFVEKAKSAGQTLQKTRETLSHEEADSDVRFEPGEAITLKKTGQAGKVTSLHSSGKVVIQMGQIRLTVSPEEIEKARFVPKVAREARRRASVDARATASTEIHLRQMRAEDALHHLEKSLDQLTLAGVEQVRIVHGKGEGILRKLVRELLKKRSDVQEIREGHPAEGGAGVTVVYFK